MFALPLSVLGEETMVSVSLGLTRLADVESEGGAAVLEAAFQALRAVKSQQRGQLGWYTPEMSRRTHERVTLLAGLRQALRSTGLFVVYQPQVALDDGRLIGLEALVRWRTEAGDFIGPDRFVPVAEQSGLICELGCFVLREALTVLTTLRESGLDAVRMAVNVSAVQFRDPDFLSELGDIIRSVGADSSKLELEITESVAMEDAAYVRASLDTIRQHGIQLAIDDFGTGYSSLAQLKQLSVDRLKIDRAFCQRSGRGGVRGQHRWGHRSAGPQARGRSDRRGRGNPRTGRLAATNGLPGSAGLSVWSPNALAGSARLDSSASGRASAVIRTTGIDALAHL
ncbi:MAG: EAL domain-containing protein [Uliginosibacterium sp.]|nr:EAL domain-containing protein [Uliginosibacterium sp.]